MPGKSSCVWVELMVSTLTISLKSRLGDADGGQSGRDTLGHRHSQEGLCRRLRNRRCAGGQMLGRAEGRDGKLTVALAAAC